MNKKTVYQQQARIILKKKFLIMQQITWSYGQNVTNSTTSF